MNRRSFLELFAAAGPVAAVAPTYFFAPVGGWKSDVITNPNGLESRAVAVALEDLWDGPELLFANDSALDNLVTAHLVAGKIKWGDAPFWFKKNQLQRNVDYDRRLEKLRFERLESV